MRMLLLAGAVAVAVLAGVIVVGLRVVGDGDPKWAEHATAACERGLEESRGAVAATGSGESSTRSSSSGVSTRPCRSRMTCAGDSSRWVRRGASATTTRPRTPRSSAVAQRAAEARDRDGEVEILAAPGDEDAHDASLAVDGRAPRVAGVRGSVRLDLLRPHAADDAARDGAAEAVRAADEQERVADARLVPARLLPQRPRADGRAVDPEHREVAGAVARDDLGAPRACIALEQHLLADLGDDVGSRDDIELAVLRPPGEAGAESLVGLDREDALEHARGQRRDPLVLLAQLALRSLQPARELLVRAPELFQPPLELANVGAQEVDSHALLADRGDGEQRDAEGREHGQPRDDHRQRMGATSSLVLVVRHTTNLGRRRRKDVPRTR